MFTIAIIKSKRFSTYEEAFKYLVKRYGSEKFANCALKCGDAELRKIGARFETIIN